MTMLRNLSDHERSFITAIANRIDPGVGDRLLSDMEVARARPTLADGSIIRFELDGYDHPTRGGQDLFPVEGSMLDQDGSKVDVLLFNDSNDRLYELEFVRWDLGDLICPDWTTLTYVPNPPEVWRPES
ncbi:MAG: hypothetical protein WCA85_23305 [Paraburkholderia sp.]|uniref:DUF6984 family protein n=1 Tax=Paraburkholderia sp. TaxID=1926495 RepID=UPI003C617EED